MFVVVRAALLTIPQARILNNDGVYILCLFTDMTEVIITPKYGQNCFLCNGRYNNVTTKKSQSDRCISIVSIFIGL